MPTTRAFTPPHAQSPPVMPPADSCGRGYPRPQLARQSWLSLNGRWDFAIDRDAQLRGPAEVAWERSIVVPFSPETPRSGIGDPGFYRVVWYRAFFTPPTLPPGSRLLLHLGAVDHSATVWVNHALCGTHEGGYTPLSVDITPFLREGNVQSVIVRAEDDPADLQKPRGKQDWQLEPHSIWYPRTTGIWQTVWLEVVPPTAIASLRWTPNLERWELGLEAAISGLLRDDLRLKVRLRCDGVVLADDDYAVIAGEVHRRIALSDPGIDDSRNELLWSPGSPRLIQADLQLCGAFGQVIDDVHSYAALRTITAEGDRVLLNGRPQKLRLVLDQGYWPECGLSAPDDHALRRDVELARAMGFNGVRKHQKIEDPRYLYWADRLGLMVWEEMPSAYRFTPRSVDRVTREWLEVLQRDVSHPCIVAWVPFNESWGVPNLPASTTERHYVRALYHLTRTLDPTRLVIGNDGWESIATDIIGVHDYDSDAERIARRYHTEFTPLKSLQRERPAGRRLVLEDTGTEHPIILSEFGGIALSADLGGTWGYSRSPSGDELGRRYAALLGAVNDLSALAGFCYTQFSDTYQEANGLLYADRTPKFPLEDMARATRGER